MGYLLLEDQTRFVALIPPGRNAKTHGMWSTYTLLRDLHPAEAWGTGADIYTCMDCPQRPSLGGGCYVDARALGSIYQAYRRGVYAPISWAQAANLLTGQSLRLGAYGELPGVVRPDQVATLLSRVRGWTGYTHAWRYCDPAWARFLMASCDSLTDYQQALQAGWRAYVVTPTDTCAASGVVRCPAYRGIGCVSCLLCAGTAKPAKSVYNPVHGFRARAALRVIQ